MAQGITITHKDFMFATAARKPFDRPGRIFDLGRSGDWIKIRTPAGRHMQERRWEEWSG